MVFNSLTDLVNEDDLGIRPGSPIYMGSYSCSSSSSSSDIEGCGGCAAGLFGKSSRTSGHQADPVQVQPSPPCLPIEVKEDTPSNDADTDADDDDLPFPDNGNVSQRTCAGCRSTIVVGRYLICEGVLWHPDCFCCQACKLPITDYEFSLNSGNQHYHKSCYREHFFPRCDVCKNFIPLNANGLIEYRAHPFWRQNYCPSHEQDGTPRCCSCERVEPNHLKYVALDDGRKQCLECRESSMMDINECQLLYLKIKNFFKGLGMKLDRQVGLSLVDKQTIEEAVIREYQAKRSLESCLHEAAKDLLKRRALCLDGERPQRRDRHITGLVIRAPSGKRVPSILIRNGLPRLMTGYTMAHEMMHAWFGLQDYRRLKFEVEEGICRFMQHLWLSSETNFGFEANGASSTSSASKEWNLSLFEQTFVQFLRHRIQSDEGFKLSNKAVIKHGLKNTLDHIQRSGNYPV